MMNIGFYAKRAAKNRTGLGNYSRFVIRILSEQSSAILTICIPLSLIACPISEKYPR